MLCVHCVPRIAHYCMVYICIWRTRGGGRGIDSPHRTCPRLINNIVSGGYGIMCLSSWFSIRLDRTPTPKSRTLSVLFSHTHIHRHTHSLSLYLFLSFRVLTLSGACFCNHYVYVHQFLLSPTCEIWERCSFSCARDLFRYIIRCSFLWKPKQTFVETLETRTFINISRHTWKTLIVIIPTHHLKRITHKLQRRLNALVACIIIYIISK